MKTLFVAWQAPEPSRAWFPVGRLDVDDAQHLYQFCYTQGAKKAEREVGFRPMPAFPDFKRQYESSTLFPLFQNRIMQSSRPDFVQYLQWMGLDASHFDPLELLGLSGGERQTDRLEVFPKLNKDGSGHFRCRFFLHGLRHTNPEGFKRIEMLREGEELRVGVEVNNPVAGLAVHLMSEDYYMLGWAPRYLVGDLVRALGNSPDIIARVVRNNRADTPLSCRVMVEVSGVFPLATEPMSSLEFQPISSLMH